MSLYVDTKRNEALSLSGEIVQPHEERLRELAAAATAAHERVRGAARRTVEEAISLGEILREAQSLAPKGEWTRWLRSNLEDLSPNTAWSYIRLANSRDFVLSGEYRTIKDALGALSGNRLTDIQKAEIERLHTEDGWSLQRIATVYGIAVSTAHYWGSQRNREMRGSVRRRSKARRRAAELALMREENKRAVMKVGGDTAKAYSLIYQASQALSRALAAVQDDEDAAEQRRSLRRAWSALDGAEQEIVRALGLEHGR